jgi:hypothetical protein
MKQTAIEWLVDKVLQTNHLKAIFEDEINQAKEMEKQQIIDFTNDFIDEHTFGDYEGQVQRNKTSEQYYNEKFNNDYLGLKDMVNQYRKNY